MIYKETIYYTRDLHKEMFMLNVYIPRLIAAQSTAQYVNIEDKYFFMQTLV